MGHGLRLHGLSRYEGLDGFSDVLLSNATPLEMEHHADRAHQVLLKFREGRYHQHVNEDASLHQPA